MNDSGVTSHARCPLCGAQSKAGAEPSDRPTVTIAQACALVHVSRRTIYNWLAAGSIAYVRTAGGAVRIYADSLTKTGA